MPITKPTTLPRWADVDPSNTAAPPSGLQDGGWVDGDAPAAEHHNWLFNLLYMWILWLNDLTNQALTWASLQTFNGEAGDTHGTRATTDAPTTRKLIDSWNLGTITARWYSTLNGGMERTVNAAWNGASWTPDDTTKPAVKELFSAGISTDYPRNHFYRKANTSGGAFADTAWDALTPNITAGAGTLTNLNATRSGDVVALEVYVGYAGATGTPTLFTLADAWPRPKHDAIFPATRMSSGFAYDTITVSIGANGIVQPLVNINNGDTIYINRTYLGG